VPQLYVPNVAFYFHNLNLHDDDLVNEVMQGGNKRIGRLSKKPKLAVEKPATDKLALNLPPSSPPTNLPSSMIYGVHQKKLPLLEAVDGKGTLHRKRIACKQIGHFMLVLRFNDHN